MAAKNKKSKGYSASKTRTRRKDIIIKKVFPKTIKAISNMNMQEIAEKVKKELAELTNFKSPSLVGVKKEGGGWVLSIELVEKNSIPDGMDILGLYEVKTDADGSVAGYERRSSRRRSDTIEAASDLE